MLDISSNLGIFLNVSSKNSGQLATILRSCRTSVGISLREVEKRTGISNAYLSQLENGRTTNPSPRLLEKLAEVFSFPYSELMEAAGYKAPDFGRSVTTLAVANLASGLNSDEQEEVSKFITHIIARRSAG